MFARSTTIQAQPSVIDAGVAYVRDEVMPALQDIPGCVGLSLLVDRRSGRCIITTSWETEDAMRDSTDQVRPIRDGAARMFGSGSTQVEQWEVAALHRDHRSQEGACARLVWVKADPGRSDAAVETYKSRALPDMEALEGFCSASLLVDRASGRGVSCVTFDTAEAMERNREDATALRERITRLAGLAMVDMCEFELAIAHLRVPELV